MSRQLNYVYFETIDTKISNGFRYETIQSRFPGATMILVPKGDPSRPIAAVSFVPNEALDSSRCDVLSALMPRDSVPQRFLPPHDTKGFNRYFQAMFNQGDREMAFVITNLVDGHNVGNTDYVKIDILKTLPEELNLTDYEEHGINRVNELRPSSSYAVRSDQTTQFRTMVLKGVRNAQGGSMSVGQIDEALRRGETLKKEENYFYINVVASDSQPEIASLLSDSTWVAADFFVRKISLVHSANNVYLSKGMRSLNGRSIRHLEEEDLSLDDMDMDDSQVRAMSFSQREFAPSNNRSRALRQDTFLADRGGQSRGVASFGQNQCVSLSVNDRSWVPYSAASLPQVRPATQQSAWATGDDIGNSQAGRVSIGNRRIDQISNKTHVQYFHNSAGEKLVLCFSVWHGMRSVPAIDKQILLQESSLLMQDAQTTEKAVLLKMLSKTYKSDDCCVCFAPDPSIVLLRCTHQCLCKDCFNQFVKKNCPLCRQIVSQTIDAQQWQNLLQ